MRKIFGLALAACLAATAPSYPQNSWPTPGGSQADGKVTMCLNSSAQAVSCTDASALGLRVAIISGGGGGGAATIADGADVAQGATTDAACAGDNTSGCTIESRLQRIAQRLTTLNTTLGSPFQVGASIGNTSFAATQGTSPWVVSAASLPLPANAAQETGGNLAQTVTDLGPPGATACATDTGSCSLNALMQRLAQRLTTLNTTLGSPFQAGGSIGNTTFGATVTAWGGGTLGAMANYGTSPGAVLVPGVNAFITNTPAVTQSGGPWTQNVTQFGGNNLATGTGAGGNGIPRVTVSNDSQLIGLTPTDRTITSASGSSQQIAAANASRHSLTIVNTGNANCGVNPTGGTAVIGGAGTLTLAPLGSYSPRVPTVSTVTVICTAGQPIYGDEN